MNKKLILSIKADVIDSRKNNKSKELPKLIDKINNKYENILVTKFILRSGDELFGNIKLEYNNFENSLWEAYEVYKSIYYISEEYKIPLYIGIGIGEIDNKNLEDANLVNGQAIWYATDAIEEIKNTNMKKEIFKEINKNKFRYNIKISNDENINDIALSYLYFIFSKILNRSEKQRMAIKSKEINKNYTNDDHYRSILTEKELEDYNVFTSGNNFSSLLKRGEYLLVKELEKNFIKLLVLLLGDDNNDI